MIGRVGNDINFESMIAEERSSCLNKQLSQGAKSELINNLMKVGDGHKTAVKKQMIRRYLKRLFKKLNHCESARISTGELADKARSINLNVKSKKVGGTIESAPGNDSVPRSTLPPKKRWFLSPPKAHPRAHPKAPPKAPPQAPPPVPLHAPTRMREKGLLVATETDSSSSDEDDGSGSEDEARRRVRLAVENIRSAATKTDSSSSARAPSHAPRKIFLSPEQKARKAAYSKARRSTEEYKAKERALYRAFSQTPAYKEKVAKQRVYRQSPAYASYLQSPAYKEKLAKQRAYRQSPAYKARSAEYRQKYRQDNKEKLAAASLMFLKEKRQPTNKK